MRVAIVDDEKDVVTLLHIILNAAGCEVDCFNDGAEALPHILRGIYDIIFLDLVMPRMCGEKVLDEIQEHECNGTVVIITGAPYRMENIHGHPAAHVLIRKPWSIHDILRIVEVVRARAEIKQ